MKQFPAAWLVWALLLGMTSRTSDAQRPAWFPSPAPLAAPTGEVKRAGTAEEVLKLGEALAPGETLLIEPGVYHLGRPLVLRGKRDVIIRSASGDPQTVTLKGVGWEKGNQRDDILHVGDCDGVLIAGITFAESRSYGVKVEAERAPRDVNIYNCRFVNIGVRAIKGSASQEAETRAVKGSVRFCEFENTKVPPADWLFGGDYIAGIDMMALEDWTFSDNVFKSIKGRNGGGRAAIFIWVRSRNVVVERNVIVDCDRGIAFGNPGQSTANNAGAPLRYVSGGAIQNNFIAGGADCGIELWHAEKITVRHNSIWRPERNFGRGIRVGTGTTGGEIVNNLVHGGIQMEGGEASAHHNLAKRLEGVFTDPAAGDLRLMPSAKEAIDQGLNDGALRTDIKGAARKGRSDLGAWEVE